ncbi:hypothetical protein BaRGS_00025619 [Batillaria attramentaria]|uniref:Uncharacterized protein n=1 Tax=Batillaria attramentaria TaxID=370345 RepID=A0ABD0K7H2_9CAEN
MADFVVEGGMVMEMKKEKDRSTNWQVCEIRALLQRVDDMKEGLFAALSMTWTVKKKGPVVAGGHRQCERTWEPKA